MNRQHSIIIAFLIAIAASACSGSGYTADAILETAPTGTVADADWTMQSAIVRRSGSDLSVTLLPIAADCDTFSPDADQEILFSIPAAVGERPLKLDLFGEPSLNQTLTFVTGPGQNTIATEGLINITAVSDTSVTVGIVADAGTNSINGTFTATICE